MRYFLRFFLWCCLVSAALHAGTDALFATVANISSDERLNVRVAPDPKSKRIASLPLGAYVGVEDCIKRNGSVWCKVYHLAQYDYEGYDGDTPEGWVNARYLLFSDEGYALVDGKAKCDYVLGCERGVCDIVSDFDEDENGTIVRIESEKIARRRLRGASHFGAAGEGDGYCIFARKYNAYLTVKHLQKFQSVFKQKSYVWAWCFIKAFVLRDRLGYEAFIHPQEGIRISALEYFNEQSRRFDKEAFKKAMESPKRYLWGYRPNEEPIVSSVASLIYDFPADGFALNSVERLTSLRGYECPKEAECQGYLFGFDYTTKPNAYLREGIVIVMQKSRDQWYVVGLLRDRWSI